MAISQIGRAARVLFGGKIHRPTLEDRVREASIRGMRDVRPKPLLCAGCGDPLEVKELEPGDGLERFGLRWKRTECLGCGSQSIWPCGVEEELPRTVRPVLNS